MSHRLRVLYVEDVRALRESIVAGLDPIRFSVVVAGGLDAAEALAAREHFDAIVCGDAATEEALRSLDTPIVLADREHLPSAGLLREQVLEVTKSS